MESNDKQKKNNHSVHSAYTYMVQCIDGSLYTGWTNNLIKRIKKHNSGKGAKYTRTRRPVKLVYFEAFFSKKEAMQREYAIKQLTRRDKLGLLKDKMTEELKNWCEEINQQAVIKEKE